MYYEKQCWGTDYNTEYVWNFEVLYNLIHVENVVDEMVKVSCWLKNQCSITLVEIKNNPPQQLGFWRALHWMASVRNTVISVKKFLFVEKTWIPCKFIIISHRLKGLTMLKYVIKTLLCDCIIPKWTWKMLLNRLKIGQTDQDHRTMEHCEMQLRR